MLSLSISIISTRFLSSIQLSNQKEIWSPFSIFQLIPFLRRSLLFTILFHTGELLLFHLYLRRSEFNKYFALINCTHRLGAYVRTFQASLHWKALLMASVLRNRSPPTLLGRRILSQAISGKPFSKLDFLQKKSLLHLSR